MEAKAVVWVALSSGYCRVGLAEVLDRASVHAAAEQGDIGHDVCSCEAQVEKCTNQAPEFGDLWWCQGSVVGVSSRDLLWPECLAEVGLVNVQALAPAVAEACEGEANMREGQLLPGDLAKACFHLSA